jgi:hypothetical protein
MNTRRAFAQVGRRRRDPLFDLFGHIIEHSGNAIRLFSHSSFLVVG